MMNKIISYFLGIMIIVVSMSFVLSQGMAPGKVSGRSSSKIAEKIVEELEKYSDREERGINDIQLIIRKIAHFVEYFFLASIIFIVIFLWVKRIWLVYFMTLLIIIPVPVVDEYLQSLTIGRTSQLFDVWIDWFGIGIAMIVSGIYLLLFKVADSRKN